MSFFDGAAVLEVGGDAGGPEGVVGDKGFEARLPGPAPPSKNPGQRNSAVSRPFE